MTVRDVLSRGESTYHEVLFVCSWRVHQDGEEAGFSGRREEQIQFHEPRESQLVGSH